MIWAWTLFLPSFGADGPVSPAVLEQGPLGLAWLRPQALFWIEHMDPLVHSLFWSIGLNTLAFVVVSIATFPGPLERLQSAQVVNVFAHTMGARGWARGSAEAEDLLMMAPADPRLWRGAGAVPERGDGTGQAGLPARHDAGISQPAGAGACGLGRRGDGACDGGGRSPVAPRCWWKT